MIGLLAWSSMASRSISPGIGAMRPEICGVAPARARPTSG